MKGIYWSLAFAIGVGAFVLVNVSGLATRTCGLPPGESGSKVSTAGANRAPAFEAQTLDGRQVRFPDDFRGRIVLVDFWATWCGPCCAEIPGLVSVYEKYHERGFDIVGITLDKFRGVSTSRVELFVSDQKMRWPQVHSDAQRIAEQYGVTAIPHAVLVDGATGEIIASGRDVLGDRLAKVLEVKLNNRPAGS